MPEVDGQGRRRAGARRARAGIEALAAPLLVGLALGVTQLYESLRFKPGSSGILGVAQAGDDPSHQAHFRVSVDLSRDIAFDADLRYVGTLPDPEVHAYEELNVHLGWRVSARWELGISGQNLLHARHQEFTLPSSDAIARSALVTARLGL